MTRAVWWLGGAERTADVTTASEVEALAEPGAQHVMGIELGGIDDGGTLSIAVDGEGERWALVVTDPQLDQWCSLGERDDATSTDVWWGESTAVPVKWFVPRSTALVAVERWLNDRTLDPAVEWCDACY